MSPISARGSHWVAAAICGSVASWIAVPFWQHVRSLSTHLQSGNWEVVSDQVSIDNRIHLKYRPFGAAFSKHKIAASGKLLSLSGQSRRFTIEYLGKTSLAEQANLRFNAEPLDETYGHFLSAVENTLENSPDRLPKDLPQLVEKARYNFDKAKDDLGPAFPPFMSTTTPSFDLEGVWARESQRLEQKGRCSGELRKLNDAPPIISADIKFFPRALEVELVRPWLSTELLDTIADNNIPSLRVFFSMHGGLRLIPESFWVLESDQVEIALASAPDASVIKVWVANSECCKIRCIDQMYTVEPLSIRSKDDVFHATLSTPEEQLITIVSKRRGG